MCPHSKDLMLFFLGVPESAHKQHFDRFSRFAGLPTVPNTPATCTTPFVVIDRIHRPLPDMELGR